MTRVLVTGAGSAAALAFIESLRGQHVSLFLADTDPEAPSLGLVPSSHRIGLPRTGSEALTEVLLQACREHRIDVVIPTRDCELLALARRRHRFTALGTVLMLPASASLETALDRWALHRLGDGLVHRPRTAVFGMTVDLARWRYPLVLKPRFRADPRPVRVISSFAEARSLRRDHALLLQEYMPGEEIEVDVLSGPLGRIIASVPRQVGGTAVRVQHRTAPIAAAGRVVRALRMSYASTVRLRRDREGRLGLVDIAPRLTRSMTASVAAGVNIPWLALQLAKGEAMPSNAHVYREVVFRTSPHARPQAVLARSTLRGADLGVAS